MLSVYTDGSSSGRGGNPIGWAFVIVRDGKPLRCGNGGHTSGTNNVAELLGAIRGLKTLIALGLAGTEPTELVSDSQYVLGMGSGRMAATINVELVTELRQLCRQTRCRFRWVRGHTGDLWNERADSLAHKAKEEQKTILRGQP